MGKSINEMPFDEATKLKLDIFSECFTEWFPVFIHYGYIKEIHIFDFFAGSGTDSIDTPGSPIVLINAAKGDSQQYCSRKTKPVRFCFNELDSRKFEKLKQSVTSHVEKCRVSNGCTDCKYYYSFSKREFKSLFSEVKNIEIFKNSMFAKFVLLDQNGFKEIDELIFRQLVSYPKTDFIFFISSSFVRRFKEHPYTRNYIDTSEMEFDESEPKNCHKIIANYYNSLLPENQDYFIHHFTIKKNANYYGLIFGTAHTLGMEKFLKVCWRKDPQSGESNFNINNDWKTGDLFYGKSLPTKKQEIRKKIREMVLSEEIVDNINGMKFTLSLGGQPNLFIEELKSLERENWIRRQGSVNNSATNIHRIPKYQIEVMKR